MEETVLRDGFTAERFQITYVPAAPGKCAVCGYAEQNGERGYLDWGMQLDFYGAVVFCTNCLTEAGNRVGWLDADQSAQLKMEHMAANDRVTELTNECDALRSSLRHYIDGKPGIGAVAESQELAKRVPPSKRPTRQESGSKPKTNRDVGEPRSNDSGSDDGDIITV